MSGPPVPSTLIVSWTWSSRDDQALLVSSALHADACLSVASTIALDAAIVDTPPIGLCLTGEDVRVPHPVEISAESLWVANVAPATPPERLSDVLAADLAGARAFVVQLRPVVVERTGDDDPDSPCEVDPDAVAFTDEQLVDGCRVRLFSVSLPAGIQAATWRNEVAYAIFESEASQGLAQALRGLNVLDESQAWTLYAEKLQKEPPEAAAIARDQGVGP